LFSDIMLGDGMDGHALAAAAKAIRPGIAILMTSGYDDRTLSDERGDADVYPLLRKPYLREQLAVAVRQALGADA
jgi:DNA-binding NtrC family response regulator